MTFDVVRFTCGMKSKLDKNKLDNRLNYKNKIYKKQLLSYIPFCKVISSRAALEPTPSRGKFRDPSRFHFGHDDYYSRSRFQFSSLQQLQMLRFTRIFYPVCCNRQQINQNTTNSSQRSKHHSILHQSCSPRHVGFRDMSTSGFSGIHFCHAVQKYCLKSTGLFFRILSKFKVFNYHIIS